MNKKIGKKYLQMVAEDSAYYIGATSAAERAAAQAKPHKCTATKRPCPKGGLQQGEFSFVTNDPRKSPEYMQYLISYGAWADKINNPDVIKEQMAKHQDNPDLQAILEKASDRIFRANADKILMGMYGEHV